MKIGQVASESGVSIDTIRFYERRGVLPVPPRTESGYRVYTDASVARTRLARRLQSLGLTLDEVIGALHAHDEGHASCETQ
ncbi:MAG TPA: MerR family transcriptional regulator [Streptosporangiaceae bacterium]|nr:MerR family transcriptional regulator [Streptosporangiaceae bacterium]